MSNGSSSGSHVHIMDVGPSTLERRTWKNWFLLAASAVLTTIGLATSIPPLLRGEEITLWPWAKTDWVLLVGLSMLVISLVIYLTQQQRRTMALWRMLEQAKELENRRVQKQNERLLTLLNVSRILSSQTTLRGAFDCITRACLEYFDADSASLMLFDNKNDELVVRSACGTMCSPEMIGLRRKVGDGIAWWAVKNRRPLLLGREETSDYPGLKLRNSSIHSSMVVPIFVRDSLVGVLNVSSFSENTKYDEQDLQALRVFAENAGAFIRQMERAAWMRKTIRILRGSLVGA